MTDENKTRFKAKRRLIILSSVFILAILAFVIGAYLENKNKTQARGVIQEDIGVLKRVTYQDEEYIEKTAVTTILLMGVDQNDDEERYTARQGGQTDFIMLYVIDHNDRTISQLQIDRDTMANVKVYGIFGNDLGTRMMQICLAHGYGTTDEENNQNAVDAVQRLLQGITVDYYATLDLASIGVINHLLGGVTVTLEDDFSAFDPTMLPGTELQLTDQQAVLFTRYRLDIGDGSNESRMRRQRTFLSAAGNLLNEKIDEDTEFLGQMYDGLQDVMTTDLTKAQLINELNTAYKYEIQPVDTLAGQHTVSSDGFMEFYVQDGAAIEWVLNVFYKPAK